MEVLEAIELVESHIGKFRALRDSAANGWKSSARYVTESLDNLLRDLKAAAFEETRGLLERAMRDKKDH